MGSPSTTIREMRTAAGLSQRALAERAATSQPAIARYEAGVSTPSWGTLERLAAACGRQLRLTADIAPDAHDTELAQTLLELSPLDRLRTLTRYARLRALAEDGDE